MKKTIFSLAILMFSTFTAFSQNEGNEILLEYQKNYTVAFEVYKGPQRILRKIDNESQVNRSTPEGLVQSYFSANNLNWLKNDYLEPESANDSRDEKHFERVKAFDKQKNYIKLMDKYSFVHDGVEMAYVFYILEIENIDFKFPTVLSCYKKQDRWYIYNLSNQRKLKELLMTLKPEIFKLILAKEKTQDSYLNDIILKVTQKNGETSIVKLHEILKSWNDKNEIENLKKYTNY